MQALVDHTEAVGHCRLDKLALKVTQAHDPPFVIEELEKAEMAKLKPVHELKPCSESATARHLSPSHLWQLF
jgi:hypothetical protein